MNNFEERQSMRDLEYAVSSLKMRMAELERKLKDLEDTVDRICGVLEEAR